MPGPWELWVVAWGCLGGLDLLLLPTLARLSGVPPSVAVGFESNLWATAALFNATVVSLWGVRKLTADFRRTAPTLASLIVGDESGDRRPIRGLASTTGPLVITLALTVLNTTLVTLEFGPRLALATAPTTFLIQLPLLAFFWTYLSLLWGLHRLGRQRLALDPSPADPTLGLRPVGTLAFTGFSTFSIGFAPVLIATATSIPTLVLNLVFFLIGVALFLLSLGGLHRQMRDVRQTQLDLARRIYAEAFAPVRRKPSARALRTQSPLLQAAEALETRAGDIQEWPFDAVLGGRIAIIVTSVVATVLARIILDALGL